MSHIDIVIPTCKSYEEIQQQIKEIDLHTSESHRVIATCLRMTSAARNRNVAHGEATSEYVVSCDDDIEGYYDGWLYHLIKPLIEEKDIRFVSARLLKPDKTLAFMMTSKFDLRQSLELVPRSPTSCYAYRKSDFDVLIKFQNETSLPFDEKFKGSGWEDNSICHDLCKRYPDTRIVINNNCKLIHLNEEKNQKIFLEENKAYFFSSRNEK